MLRRPNRGTHLTVKVSADEEVRDDGDGVCVVLYRSVGELLLDAAKHAGVTSASVGVRRVDAGRIEVLVEDEGGG